MHHTETLRGVALRASVSGISRRYTPYYPGADPSLGSAIKKGEKVNYLRKHGEKPYKIAVIHGGPGAFGEMQPIARFFAANCGVLEPFQTEGTLEKQLIELKSVLEENIGEANYFNWLLMGCMVKLYFYCWFSIIS